MDATRLAPEPLAQRMRGYLAVFAIGVGAAGIVGVVVWLASSARLSDALGYTFIALGTLLLLIGGARGGGYSNLGVGAVEALMGGRNRAHDDYESDEELRRGDVMKKRDPMARLRRGLRPQANPAAFWQVIAGLLYVAIGVGLALALAPPPA
ncbi:MAG: hypothetical protein ABIJ48_04970 [Actinomycetota bacterium]